MTKPGSGHRNPPGSDYIADIGVECHVQLKTRSKLFCACGNDARGVEPNCLLCPVCLGLPGTLPMLNKRAVELAIRAGYVLGAEISTETKFDRKNYFYPDLPKGYQITQYDQPIVGAGQVVIPMQDEDVSVGIVRAHMEEDAGKLVHPEEGDHSLVDLNRAGTPLLEIVSEPDMHTPAQAKAYTQELYYRMLYAGISDVDLYHGNMRFDLNISVRHRNQSERGIRTETKNLNSFRSVERAAAYEIERQIELLESGRPVTQETRGWDETRTYVMRSKEEADDYRYFPEPDLPSLTITQQVQDEAVAEMPRDLDSIRKAVTEAGLSRTQLEALLNEPAIMYIQLEVVDRGIDSTHVQRIANWLSSEVVRMVRDSEFNWDEFRLSAENLEELSRMVEEDKLSSTGAKHVLSELLVSGEPPRSIAEARQLLQVSDEDKLASLVDQVIADNPGAAQDVRNGEMKAIGFLTGQVMQASGGQANPQKVQELLQDRLS